MGGAAQVHADHRRARSSSAGSRSPASSRSSGFWSKDEILASAWATPQLRAVGGRRGRRGAHRVLHDAPGVARLLRQRAVVDATRGARRRVRRHGPPLAHEAPTAGAGRRSRRRTHDEHVPQPHESPSMMTLPLVVLAGLAVLGGLFNLPFRNENFDILTGGWNPSSAACRNPRSARSALGFALSTVALVVGGRAASCSAARSIATGCPRTGEDPVAKRLGPFAKVLANAYYFDVGIASFVSGPVTAFARFLSDDVDRKGDRRRGQRHRARLPRGRWRPAQAPDRSRAQLRARHRVRHGAAASATCSCGRCRSGLPDPHDAHRPPRDRRADHGADAERPPRARARRRLRGERRRRSAIAIYLVFDFDRSDAGYQFVSSHAWMEPLGVRWTVGVDGISLFMVALTALLIPIGLLASADIQRSKSFIVWMLLLEAALIGVFLALDLILFFVFFEVVLVPMYFLIAGWGHDNRRYAAMKFFLFTHGRLRVPVRRHPVGRVPAPQRQGLPDVRHAHAHRVGLVERRAVERDREVAVPRVRDRVRGEGAVVPVAHVAPRRAHRRADRRIGRAGRRAAQDGHLRVLALRDPDVPAGRGRPRAAAARAGGDRHHVRRDRRDDATQPEARRRVLVGRAPRLRRARVLRAHRSRASRAASSRCCRTGSRRVRCSSSSGCSTNAATRTRSPTTRACGRRSRSSAACSSSPTFASIGLPGFSGLRR